MNHSISSRLKPLITVFGSIIAGMLCVQLVNSSTGYSLNRFGIYPRHIEGLVGIVCAPWLHVSWQHLWGNLFALIPLGILVCLRSVRYFLCASFVLIIAGGLLTWAFGREALHVGASGWVFGLMGLSLANAWFERNLASLIVAVIVLVYFGASIATGLLPSAQESFEGHWFGAIAGILFARLSYRGRRK